MHGIYIHIPFCKKKCFYCDFYTSLSLDYKEKYLSALNKEIALRMDYLSNNEINTVYFGGGTPSVLNAKEINEIFDTLSKYYIISKGAEITLEANPDDLTEKYLKDLRKTPVNRLSIGIQSFFDDDLRLMNRRHSSGEAIRAVKFAQGFGFDNISGDLIYGLPNMTGEKWKENLKIFFNLKIPHLSAYHLTYEPNTVFSKYLKNGKIKSVGEGSSNNFFDILIGESENHDFRHYEISNFAKSGYFSQHNSSYWQQKEYLGLGASAHSYNKNSRQWNVSNLKKYIDRVGEGQPYFEKEILSQADKYNDYVITSIRTIWGIDTVLVKNIFGEKYYNFLIKNSQKFISSNHIKIVGNTLLLTKKGMFISDMISEAIFY